MNTCMSMKKIELVRNIIISTFTFGIKMVNDLQLSHHAIPFTLIRFRKYSVMRSVNICAFEKSKAVACDLFSAAMIDVEK